MITAAPSGAAETSATQGPPESARARLVCRALDAALTAGLQVPASGSPMPQSIYERLRRFIRVTSFAVPGGLGLIRRSLLDFTAMPFDAKADPIAFGAGSTVFHLHSTPPCVVKVSRRTLGQPVEVMRRLARECRERYSTTVSWYGGADYIVPTYFVIMQAPLCGYPAVVSIQPYIPGAEDFLARPDDEVLTLLGTHEGLRRQFQSFAEHTLRLFDHHHRCPDLLGDGNLAITIHWNRLGADGDPQPRLCLIDFGFFDVRSAGMRAESARRMIEIIERIRRLSAVVAENAPIRPSGPAADSSTRERSRGPRRDAGASALPR